MEKAELEDLLQVIRNSLGEQNLAEYGGIFYSGWGTLQTGNFYLMGLNPGGNPQDKALQETINQTLKKWLCKSEYWSEYRCERWKKGVTTLDPGKAQHQRNVVYLCNEVLRQDVRSVFSANAIFVRTPTGDGLPKDEIEKELYTKCWQVHRRLMSIIQPTVLICLGNNTKDHSSSFQIVKRWLQIEQVPEPKPLRCGKENVYIRYFDKPITFCPNEGGRPIKFGVLGIPHPSRYWYHNIDKFEETIQNILKKWDPGRILNQPRVVRVS